MCNSITLEAYEIEMAAFVGMRRTATSVSKGYKHSHGADRNALSWGDDIEAALAEMAFAKFTGMYWGGGVNTFKLADVGTRIQIRHTKREDGCLIIRNNDSKDDVYVLVTGSSPTFTIAGWYSGDGEMNPAWRQQPNGRPASWFIPQSELKLVPRGRRGKGIAQGS